MTDDRKAAPRAPRAHGRRTTLRVPTALAAAVDDLASELGISRNDALLRLATRGARLHEEERVIADTRAARLAAVFTGSTLLDDDAYPPADEAREAVLSSRDLT